MIITALRLNESAVILPSGINFDVISIIDAYYSVIWVDRYNDCGEFELVLPADDKYILGLKEDDILVSNESESIMVIEKINIQQEETSTKLYLSGQSIESFLRRRIIYEKTFFNGQNISKYPDPLNDPSMVVNAISSLLEKSFFGTYDPDNLRSTNAIDTNVYVDGTLEQGHPFLSMFVNAYIYNQNLYDVISDICKQLNIGFKFKAEIGSLNLIKFRLYLYYGLVLTDQFDSDQPYYNPNLKVVIFSETFDNLLTSDYNIDKTTYKNVIKVDGVYHEDDPVNNGQLIETPITIEVEGQIKQDDGNYIEPYGLLRREDYLDGSSITDQDQYSVILDNLGSALEFNTNHANTDALLNTIGSVNTIGYFRVSSYDMSAQFSLSQAGPWLSVTWADYNIGIIGSYAVTTFSVKLVYSQAGSSQVIISQDQYEKRLENEGKGELMSKEYLEEFAAEVNPEINFTYGTDPEDDYYLGDVVTVRNKYGVAAYCRVTEYIHSEDESGKSNHPTFTIGGSNIGTET